MVEYEKNKNTNTIEQQQKVYNFAQDQVKTAAPEILKQMANLDNTQKEAFLTGLAKQYKIDINSLKGMLETARYDVAKDEKAIAPKATATKTSSGSSSTRTSSTTSTQSANFSPEIMSWANKIQAGSADIASVPSALRGQVNLAVDSLEAQKANKSKTISSAVSNVLNVLTQEDYDEKGFITAQSFKEILADFVANGYSRADVLTAFKDKLYRNKYKFAKNYGITDMEFEKYLKN